MVERMKDDDRLALEALFRSEPIADDGFSARVVRRIRRRILLRRLALPLALVVGLLIAFKPALQLLSALFGLVSVLPADLIQFPADALPQLSTLIVGGAVIAMVLFFIPALED